MNPVDPDDVMQALRNLSLRTFTYADDPRAESHLGPEGGSFASAFNLGSGTDMGIADMAGMSLAAAQALDQRPGTVEDDVAGIAGDTGLEDRMTLFRGGVERCRQAGGRPREGTRRLRRADR